MQAEHEPPQSTADSVPSFFPFEQLTHTFPKQLLLLQSEFCVHAKPSAHPLHTDPPQSKPVSSPFLCLSAHDTHTPLEFLLGSKHCPLWQSLLSLHAARLISHFAFGHATCLSITAGNSQYSHGTTRADCVYNAWQITHRRRCSRWTDQSQRAALNTAAIFGCLKAVSVCVITGHFGGGLLARV